MDIIYPANENKRLTDRRTGIIKRNSKVIDNPTNCFMCKHQDNIIVCKVCSKLACQDCHSDNICMICDKSEEQSCGQRCISLLFRCR